MKFKSALIAFALTLILGACGKKDEPEPAPPSGPQSSQGKILDFAQKTIDQANERTRRIAEDVEQANE